MQGTTLLAYATLALVVSGKDVPASILGSIAAGLECENDGNVPIYPRMVLEKLEKLRAEVNYNEKT